MTVDTAAAVRADVLRMTNSGRSSHVGSALSCADILAVLYAGCWRSTRSARTGRTGTASS